MFLVQLHERRLAGTASRKRPKKFPQSRQKKWKTQPSKFTLALGPYVGYTLAVFVLLEGLLYGFGLWWFSYLYIWAILAVAAWLFRKMESRLGWGLLCGFYGLLFGTLTAIPVLILSGPAATLAYIISGIPFDLIHGVSNFLLAFLLLPTLRRILARLTRSLNMGTLYFE